MPSLLDVQKPEAAEKLMEEVAAEELERISAVLANALHGSREAVATYVDAYRQLLVAVLSEISSERPDLVAATDDGFTTLEAEDNGGLWLACLEQQAITAPFSSWAGIAGSEHGVALAVLSYVREAVAELDPLVPPRGKTARPNVALTAWELALFRRTVSDELSGDTPALKRIQQVFELNKSELGGLLGVTRQAAAQWLEDGVPRSRSAQVLTVAEIADRLDHNLKSSQIPAIARRPAEAYGGRTMLEVIADGEADWLLEDIEESFDYATTA